MKRIGRNHVVTVLVRRLNRLVLQAESTADNFLRGKITAQRMQKCDRIARVLNGEVGL